MTKQNPRLVGELTAQEEAEIVALEASIRDIHQLATMNPEDARRAAKAINSIRNEAARGLQTLLAVDVDGLDAYHRRDYLVQVETFSRTLAAANKVPSSRPV